MNNEPLYYCPKCGSLLVKRTGTYGEFLGCSDFPKCNYSMSLETDYYGEKCREFLDFQEKRKRKIEENALKRRLRKCPFCGGTGKIVEVKEDPESGPGFQNIWYVVKCKKCGCKGPSSMSLFGNDRSECIEDAINKWNGKGRK